MEILTNVLVLVHLIGMAGIVGGWISLRARRVESGMGLSVVVWGARFQILSGLALVGIHESQGHALNHAKVGVKLAVALACAAAAEMAAAKARRAPTTATSSITPGCSASSTLRLPRCGRPRARTPRKTVACVAPAVPGAS